MIYQKILTDGMPYELILSEFTAFTEHRHADIEFNYCIKGSFDIIINKKKYHVNEGEVSLISPMTSHEIPDIGDDDERLVLTTIVGATFLREHFGAFTKSVFSTNVLSLNEPTETNKKLRSLLDETVELYQNPARNSSLIITGNLYKIFAYLIDELTELSADEYLEKRDLRMVANIEKALELIYHDYTKPITIEDAAIATGYGKSNFCKIFKNIVGDSFHCVLNRQRIKSSYGLLSETTMSIAEIAQEVGFGEAKTFCRVFKNIAGITPGEYRKNKKAMQD
jgi:xylan 1,4-beta-xylosidase